ncbi:hypothetical protein MNBD_ALPHA08-310, partial [hydrothermal vent metagenome]
DEGVGLAGDEEVGFADDEDKRGCR